VVPTSDIATRMANNAIRTGSHAFGFATLSTHGSLGAACTEVAEGTVLLRPATEVACHQLVASMFAKIHHKLLL
jgi:hypothetical protein